MQTFLKSITKTRVAAVSLLIMTLWLFLIARVAGTFQTVHNVDPLSMIDVLFPYFWILLILLVSLCLTCHYMGMNSKWLHSLLLSEIALFLFFTPFMLSGFSWNPDGLWHGGIASYMPQILGGAKLPLGVYAESYPLSFVLNYFMEEVTGLSVFMYGLYVYPVLSTLVTTLLGYLFLSRLFSPRAAFLSMLFALPAMHFIEPHTSPFSLGTIFVLGALVLLTIDGKLARGLLFLMIFAGILTHPISPLSLGIFLTAVILLTFLSGKLRFTRLYGGIQSRVSYRILLVLAILWFAWTMAWSFSTYQSIGYTISRIVSLRFLSQIEHVSQFTTSGGFMYRNISLLEQSVYVIIAAFAIIIIVLNLLKLALHKKTNYLDSLGVLFSLLTLAYAAYSYALFLSTGEQTLLGRGLLFFVLTGGVCMALLLNHHSSTSRIFKAKSLLLAFCIMFFFVSFPVVSYSREAYNTFTPSSGSGLSFISTYANLSRLSVSTSADQQLAAYVNLSNGLKLEDYPPQLNESRPDFVILRINLFFSAALRYDRSFENNSYTRLRDSLQVNVGYDVIYSNPAFDVYSASGN